MSFAMFSRRLMAILSRGGFAARFRVVIFVVLERLLLVQEVERWLMHVLAVDFLHFGVDADLDVLLRFGGLASDDDLVLTGQRREWSSLRALSRGVLVLTTSADVEAQSLATSALVELK